MGRNETEFFLSLYMKKRKDLLESILGLKLEKIQLEQTNGRKKIDFSAINVQRRLQVFIENQKTSSDLGHLNEKVLPIIQGLQEGIVVWISSKFNTELIAAVKDLLNQSKHKYINFYAIEVSSALILELEGLNEVDRLKVWDKLDTMDRINQPFRLVDKHERIPKTHMGKAIVENYNDLNRIEDIQEYILEQLRITIPSFLNIHKSKKCNQNNRSISIGGGVDGITFRCSVKDRDNRAYVKLCFDSNHSDEYKQLFALQPLMKEMIHPQIKMEKRSIIISFNPSSNLDDTVLQIGELLGKMVTFFDPIIHGRKNINYYLGEIRSEKEDRKVPTTDIIINPREWLMMPGIEPWIAELLAEEISDEHALQVNQERLAEYLNI
ncbi:hypothetical protein ACFCP7_24560 [Paenibacillus elgii]